MNLKLEEIERRVNHSVYQDGLTEIIMGIFLFFYGGLLNSNAVVLLPIIFGVILFVKPIIERIKIKFIYPRSGYVRLPPESQSTGRGIGIAALVMVIGLLGTLGILTMVYGADAGRNFFMTYIVPPVSGILLAIGPVWMGQKYGLIRGYIWAALFVLSGIAMPLFNIETGYAAVGLMCSLVGLVILITGSIIFFQFIRRNEPQILENGGAVDGK